MGIEGVLQSNMWLFRLPYKTLYPELITPRWNSNIPD